ncbi:MAG: gamma-glutamylcyclotransferase [Rhizobiaceae bacterium]|nr:gamma-glutamylcyclotransferase [Rhizobiaceae bacterium]
MKRRRMRLTPELVARVAHDPSAPPAPFPPDTRPATDADHQAVVSEILRTAPDARDVWVFAYGSLIWNPACQNVEQRSGRARGWHRSFCLGWDRWFRGSAERPGLMLALDRGGSCTGVVFKLPPDAVTENLFSLSKREVQVVPHPFPARWINVDTDLGAVRAVTFAIDREAEPMSEIFRSRMLLMSWPLQPGNWDQWRSTSSTP